MESRILKELQKFNRYLKSPNIGKFKTIQLDEYSFYLEPKIRTPLKSNRFIDITLLALMHGNEVSGICVLNKILDLIYYDKIECSYSIGFALGNVESSKKNVRFINYDMNRSFSVETLTYENEKRVNQLKEIFCNSYFLLDFHQTQSPSLEPFFISKFDTFSFSLVRNIFPEYSFVTYQDANFSKLGMTGLNYHLGHGGCGVSFELGEKGFFDDQIQLGVDSFLKFINYNFFDSDKNSCLKDLFGSNVYTFYETKKTLTGIFCLKQGLKSFQNILCQEIIGTVDDCVYKSPVDGKILFPKYPKINEKTILGTEVFRILKQVKNVEDIYA